MARGKSRSKDRHGPGRLDDGDGDGPTWLTTYADAITLLMAFFVILYAMSQVDQVKFEKLIAGFAEPFGNDSTGRNSGDVSLLDSGAGLVELSTTERNHDVSEDDPFAEVLNADPVRAPSGPRFEPVDTSGEQAPQTGLPVLDVRDLDRVREQIEDALLLQAEIDNVDFEIVGNQLVVSIDADEVLFPSGSDVLQPRGREVLAAMAPVLNEFANVIEIVGHTDDRPLRRDGYTNWDLSGDRALAVLDVLAAEYGVDPRRLGYRGYGEQRPLVPNDSPENRARNRRVELVIVATP